MQNELEMILKDVEAKLANVQDKLTLTQTSALFLGKNGALSGLMKGLRELSNE